jgi:hypothetical protein
VPAAPAPAGPDHEAFVEWFVAYWRRRGAQLFTDQATGEETLNV